MKQAIMITAKLYNYRDTAKRFFGDEFENKIAPYKRLLTEIMQRDNIEEIPALLKISKTEYYDDNGIVQLLFVAATVELIEQH